MTVCVIWWLSSFPRLGGMISAYKIVPDEIDEIKVCNLSISKCIILAYVSMYSIFFLFLLFNLIYMIY